MLNESAARNAGPDRGSVTFIGGLSEVADRYDIVLCDIWGVLHDGVTGFVAASDALRRFRDGGGRVVLVSNAPRQGAVVLTHLDGFGIPRDAYDDIRTSGDLTRQMVSRQGDRPFHHIGPGRDLGLFDGLPAAPGPLDEAEYVVCTGLLDDETETVEDYREALAAMRARDLLMISANPDIVVERGHRLIACAGALAAAYDAMGGRSVTPGKPHPPIYEVALARGAELIGREPDRARVLAIGDAIGTDILGGRRAGIATLLVARGIHASDLGHADGGLDEAAARAWLAGQAAMPDYATGALAWDR